MSLGHNNPDVCLLGVCSGNYHPVTGCDSKIIYWDHWIIVFLACPDNCWICDNPTQCSVCQVGFIYEASICERCTNGTYWTNTPSCANIPIEVEESCKIIFLDYKFNLS